MQIGSVIEELRSNGLDESQALSVFCCNNSIEKAVVSAMGHLIGR